MDDGSKVHSDSKRTSCYKKIALFGMDSVQLHYTRAVGIYQQYSGAGKTNHINEVEQAIYLWRVGVDWEDVLA